MKVDKAVLMLVALASVSSGVHGSESDQKEKDALRDVVPIVSAQVSSVSSEGSVQKVILVVKDVYFGSADLAGRTFTVMNRARGSYVLSLPKLKVGEIGIWLVRSENGTITPAVYEMLKISATVQLPAIESNQLKYKEAVVWAKAVQQISHAEPKRRIGLLKQAAVSSEPVVSAWAVETIGRTKSKGQVAFLERLVENKKLPIRGQVMLDAALAKLKGKKWYLSEARGALLRKWVRSKMGARDAGKVLVRIDVSWQHRTTSTERTLALVKTMVLNEGIPLAVRERCCGVTGSVVIREKDGDKAFKLLVELVQRKKEPRIRIAAAYAIRHSVGADKARLAAIRTVRMKVADQKVRKILGEAIERAEKALKSKTEKSRQSKP